MYFFKEIDEEEYEVEDDNFCASRCKIVAFKKKKTLNNKNKNNKNRFFFKSNLLTGGENLYFGEVIGSIIAKRTIGNACEASLALKNRHYKNYYDKGAISYYYLAEEDNIIPSSSFISAYYAHENMQRKSLPRIEDVKKAMSLFLIKRNRPNSEINYLFQQYIDMIVFDCRYGNYDRLEENWMLYEDGKTNEVRLYPLFDNERILGFDLLSSKYETSEKVIDFCQGLKMAYIASKDGKNEFSRVEDILKYLLTSFPVQTKLALEKVNSFALQDLSDLLEEFPDLTETRKEFTKKMYIARGLLFEKYISDFEKDTCKERLT